MNILNHFFGSSADQITWWQMSARAALILVYAIILYRLAARRAFVRNTALDIMVAIILGSTFSRTITGNAGLLPALAATALLVALNSAFAALSFRSRFISRLINGSSVIVIDRGQIDWRNARRVNIGEDDLDEALRLHGLDDAAGVKAAYMERNGRISVIRKRPEAT